MAHQKFWVSPPSGPQKRCCRGAAKSLNTALRLSVECGSPANVRPMSHLQFSSAILSREFSLATKDKNSDKLQVSHGESREFLTVAQLYFRCNYVDRMLNADWSVVIVVFVLFLFAVHIRLFCIIYFNLFNLFNLEME